MRVTLIVAILWFSALSAWAHGDDDHDDDAESIDVSGVSVPEHITYHEHVRPIIEANCVACHSEGRIAGYAPLIAAEDVVWAAQDIQFHVVNGIMPPWPPSRANRPLKHDRSLSFEEIAIIDAWVDRGAELGDPAEYTPAATDAVEPVPIRADLILQLDEPYEPAPDVLDDYRCFAFELNIDAPQFVTGYEFVPDVAAMAHHNLVYLFDDAANREIQERNYADGRPGWPCYAGAGLSSEGEWIAGWGPGTSPIIAPEGAGILIRPGQRLVVQMYYNFRISRQPDRSRVVLQLESAESELAELMIVPLGAPVEIPCPAGVEGAQCEREAALERAAELYGEAARHIPDYLLSACGQSLDDYGGNSGEKAVGYCDYPIAGPLTVFGVSGHMHDLGRSFRLELNPESEAPQLLLDIPRWDVYWQGGYTFEDAVRLASGDVLRMTCVWDDSPADDPRYRVTGEGAADESCFGTLLALKP